MPTKLTRTQHETVNVFADIPTESETAVMTVHTLSFREAVDIIEGRDENTSHHRRVRQAIERHIAETSDNEAIGVGYYYLIRAHLLECTFRETLQLRELYTKMLTAFTAAESHYHAQLKKSQGGEHVILRQQTTALYQLINAYLKTLEVIYTKNGFQHAEERVHEDRMRFRRRAAGHAGQHVIHAGHLFMEHTSRYGHSFTRWGMTVGLSLTLFAAIYFALDHVIAGGVLSNLSAEKNFSEYLYFSTVVFTTVGFGDIMPIGLARLVAGMEGILGYVMLGIFITLLQKRL